MWSGSRVRTNLRWAAVWVGAPHSLQASSGCSFTTVPVMTVRRTPSASSTRMAPVGQTWAQAPQPMQRSAGRVKSK